MLPNKNQYGALRNHVTIAKRTCGAYWRLALAISAHESAFWSSHLSRAHNNHFGIKATPGQRKADTMHRDYSSEPEDSSWRSWRYLLERSSNYREDRETVCLAESRGKSQRALEQIWISLWNSEPGCYCPDPEWGRCVRAWHDLVWQEWPE